MRKVLTRLFILALGTAVLPLMAVVTARAQAATNITMTPTGDPKLSGTVAVTPAGPNQVNVVLTVKGLPANDERVSHIHSPGTGTGACDSGGPIVYPLSNVKADANGNATATSMVTFDPAKGIPTSKWYFNVHAGTATQVGAGVICGLITAPLVASAGAAATAASAAAGAAAAPSSLPSNGGVAPSALLLALLAVAGLSLTGAGLVVARRRA